MLQKQYIKYLKTYDLCVYICVHHPWYHKLLAKLYMREIMTAFLSFAKESSLVTK